jgi:hypothetical protein
MRPSRRRPLGSGQPPGRASGHVCGKARASGGDRRRERGAAALSLNVGFGEVYLPGAVNLQAVESGIHLPSDLGQRISGADHGGADRLLQGGILRLDYALGGSLVGFRFQDLLAVALRVGGAERSEVAHSDRGKP